MGRFNSMLATAVYMMIILYAMFVSLMVGGFVCGVVFYLVACTGHHPVFFLATIIGSAGTLLFNGMGTVRIEKYSPNAVPSVIFILYFLMGFML